MAQLQWLYTASRFQPCKNEAFFSPCRVAWVKKGQKLCTPSAQEWLYNEGTVGTDMKGKESR